MTVKLFSFLFLLSSLSSFSQSEKTDHYLTQEENETWLANFQKLDNKNAQLEAVKEKIIFDAKFNYSFITGICAGVGEHARIKTEVKNTKSRIKKNTADCKIFFVLNTDQSYFLNLKKQENHKEILDLLNASNIDTITPLNRGAMAIYGARASCGAVMISSKNAHLIESLKKLSK